MLHVSLPDAIALPLLSLAQARKMPPEQLVCETMQQLLQQKASPTRRLNLWANQGYWVADDFDAPLPDDMTKAFYGE